MAAAAAKKSGGKKKSNFAGDTWKYVAFLILLCGGGLQVVVPALEALFGGSSRAPSAFTYHAVKHVQHDISDSTQLQRVFFSGESWLVLCNNHTQSEDVNDVFERAAAMLHHTEKASNSHHVFTAVLPCYGKLPSGKNVFERWNLPLPTTTTIDRDDSRLPKRQPTNRDGSSNSFKHYQPTAFYVSNGDKPQALAASFFGYREKDDAITTTAHKLAEFVRSNSKPRNVVTVTNSGHLTSYCTKKRHCALFLYQSVDFKMPAETRAEINRLCSTYRSLRCASLDVTRYKSSLVKSLPAVNAGAAAWPRLVLTKKLTPDEIKKMAEEEAAEQPPSFDETPRTPEEIAAEEANPSRTVNPKARTLSSIGVLAKGTALSLPPSLPPMPVLTCVVLCCVHNSAHRGMFEYGALASFLESVAGVAPAWPNADEAPLRAAPVNVAPEDRRMTRLNNWPTVSVRPSSELPKKPKAPKKPKSAEELAAEAQLKAKREAEAAERKKQREAEIERRRAAGEADAREKMEKEEQERNPQEADPTSTDSDAADDSASEDGEAEESIDFDASDSEA